MKGGGLWKVVGERKVLSVSCEGIFLFNFSLSFGGKKQKERENFVRGWRVMEGCEGGGGAKNPGGMRVVEGGGGCGGFSEKFPRKKVRKSFGKPSTSSTTLHQDIKIDHRKLSGAERASSCPISVRAASRNSLQVLVFRRSKW